MFDRLRENYPSATIYVLCSDQNIAALDLMDVVDAEHVIAVRIGSLGALATDTVRAVRRMRAIAFERCWTSSCSPGSAPSSQR